TIDTGVDTRTIVSGIAAHYSPEQMIGKNVLVLINLAPRELKGIVSQGMILMVEDELGNLIAVSPEKEAKAGSIVG
ncbi:MAG: methionine--tRNA ligase, partial [Rikenellaceae bacterium]